MFVDEGDGLRRAQAGYEMADTHCDVTTPVAVEVGHGPFIIFDKGPDVGIRDLTDGMSKELSVPVNVFSLAVGENDSLAGDHEDGSRSQIGRWGPAEGAAESYGHRLGDGELGRLELGRNLGLRPGMGRKGAEVVLGDGGANAEAFQDCEEFFEHFGYPVSWLRG